MCCNNEGFSNQRRAKDLPLKIAIFTEHCISAASMHFVCEKQKTKLSCNFVKKMQLKEVDQKFDSS